MRFHAVRAKLPKRPPWESKPDSPDRLEGRKNGATQKEDVIAAKVFVGNLNYETTDQELRSLFSEAGEVVEVFVPLDRHSGRPRGFAFVEFADQDAVAEAIEKFDGHELKGRSLRVNEAQERPSRAPRIFDNDGGGGFGGGGGGGGFNDRRFAKPANPKGSRRNLRGKKRSL